MKSLDKIWDYFKEGSLTFMGYYTQFEISATKDKEGLKKISHEQNLRIAYKLSEISDWFDKDNVIEDVEYPLEYMIERESMKWYGHYEDMTRISKAFPDIYFELSGWGEESNDIWKEYFYQGESFVSEGRITYDKPSWL